MGFKLKFVIIFLCVLVLAVGFSMAWMATIFMASILVSMIKLIILAAVITTILMLFIHRRKKT